MRSMGDVRENLQLGPAGIPLRRPASPGAPSAGAALNGSLQRATVLSPDIAQRVRVVAETVREVSLQADPAQMVTAFGRRMGQLIGRDRTISLSRRALLRPWFRVTRSSEWQEPVNPWREPERLPLLEGGLLSDFVYGNELRVFDDFRPPPEDPAFEYLRDMRSCVAIPLFDGGESLNMVVMLARAPGAFEHTMLPDLMLQANLFGRATQHLLSASRVREAYAELDREMNRIGELQRALLPAALPEIPGVSLAVSYETAARAGGDYYDFFDLGDGRWGILIGDVSGHGASAAVVMALTRTLLHARCRRDADPRDVLMMANAHLVQQGDRYDGTFVTAFYAIFDPGRRTLHYASAGHNPPLLMRADGEVRELDAAQSLPLGVAVGSAIPDAVETLRPGDTFVLYTDGITEAMNRQGQMYGRERLLLCMSDPTFSAAGIIDCILGRLHGFTEGQPAADDRTLLALRIRGEEPAGLKVENGRAARDGTA